MKKAPKTQAHIAYFRIVLDVGMNVSGNTMTEAIEAAQQLGVTDVVDLDGLEYNDGNIQVTGIYTTTHMN